MPGSKALTRAASSLPSMCGITTILLVEDDPLLLEFAHCTLQQLGYLVLPCSSADEALQTLAEQYEPVDLLLTDA